jgi:hypothetical protein
MKAGKRGRLILIGGRHNIGLTRQARGLASPQRKGARSGCGFARAHRRREEVVAQKVCRKCQRTLPATSFSKHRRRKDGLNTKCRECCSAQWKKNNSSPCVDCKGPRRSPTPGQCIRCYRMTALLKRTEYEALAIIPMLIYEAGRPVRDLAKALAGNKVLSPSERLSRLVEQLTNGM